MHTRENKVERWFLAKLLNELTQIALNHAIALSFKCIVEMDLLGGHALRLDDSFGSRIATDLRNNLTCFGAIAGPVNFPAITLKVGRKGRQCAV